MDSVPPPIQAVPIAPISLLCPYCHAKLAVSPRHAGLTINCPKCDGRFQVPILTASHSQASSQPLARDNNAAVRDFATKKVAAGLCGILLGGLGVHKFILGFNAAGVIMLVVWIGGLISGLCLVVPLVASIAMNVIGLIEGIIYLTKTDEEFYQTYAVQKRDWF